MIKRDPEMHRGRGDLLVIRIAARVDYLRTFIEEVLSCIHMILNNMMPLPVQTPRPTSLFVDERMSRHVASEMCHPTEGKRLEALLPISRVCCCPRVQCS